jgi:hypothetical protein
MKLDKSLKALCDPARFYLGISIFVIVFLLVQNLLNGDSSKLCVGVYKCDTSHIVLFFIVKILYIAFWTWLLNLLCQYGLKTLSWFLVLIPFLLFAVILSVYLYLNLSLPKVKTVESTK